ncbi:hypothetical protein [Bacillus sp. B-jedd]|uniref:hypothetical protein n=1 Tax=Bacillus sp. B-jedd TaxID=1476857 RepID=UPI000662525F|nr:hypothetical protein [Bacillus sp. B-jedd]
MLKEVIICFLVREIVVCEGSGKGWLIFNYAPVSQLYIVLTKGEGDFFGKRKITRRFAAKGLFGNRYNIELRTDGGEDPGCLSEHLLTSDSPSYSGESLSQ